MHSSCVVLQRTRQSPAPTRPNPRSSMTVDLGGYPSISQQRGNTDGRDRRVVAVESSAPSVSRSAVPLLSHHSTKYPDCSSNNWGFGPTRLSRDPQSSGVYYLCAVHGCAACDGLSWSLKLVPIARLSLTLMSDQTGPTFWAGRTRHVMCRRWPSAESGRGRATLCGDRAFKYARTEATEAGGTGTV